MSNLLSITLYKPFPKQRHMHCFPMIHFQKVQQFLLSEMIILSSFIWFVSGYYFKVQILFKVRALSYSIQLIDLILERLWSNRLIKLCFLMTEFIPFLLYFIIFKLHHLPKGFENQNRISIRQLPSHSFSKSWNYSFR